MMASFYYYDQSPSGFPFLCKLSPLLFKLAGITKFKSDRKNEKNSGRSSKMTPSCKWLLAMPLKYKNYPYKLSLYRHRILECELFNREE